MLKPGNITDIFWHLGVRATVHHALRLGSKGNKSRLLKVTVNSDKEKAAVNIASLAYTVNLLQVIFTKSTDLTPQQQC